MSDHKQILMIDDDPAFCRMVSDMLADTVCRVTATTDFREGLRQAMTHPPDLILLDIHMPEVSGLDLIRQLRNMQSTRHVPVMMVTGDDRIASVQAAREYQAVGYILKPFKPLFLLEKISALLGMELVSGLQQARLASEENLNKEPIRIKTRTLLVIDDEPAIYQLVEDLLEETLVKVLKAADAREGLRLAMTSPVDAILLDVNMPDLSGLEVAEQLRHMRTTRNLPVILMSGTPAETLAPQLIEAGIDEFLAKPFTPVELFSLLQRVLKKEIFWS